MGLIEEEVARKRDWLTPSQFTQVYTVLKLFPGPFSTQMADLHWKSPRADSRRIRDFRLLCLTLRSVGFVFQFLVRQTWRNPRGRSEFFGFQFGALVIIFQVGDHDGKTLLV